MPHIYGLNAEQSAYAEAARTLAGEVAQPAADAVDAEARFPSEALRSLAEAGLLAGRRATTHWAACERLAERYPDVEVESDPIFVRDGRVYTSAGVCAGMDLALALVEEDLGRELALAVAQRARKRTCGTARASSTERDGNPDARAERLRLT